MENKIIVANHKSFLDYVSVNEYINHLDEINLNNVIICPSNIYLPLFCNKKYHVGVQDISLYDDKNITGEVSISHLKDMNIEYTIIGHNDRKMYFDETNKIINNKIKNATKCGLNVILCVGEIIQNDNIENIKKYIIYNLNECLKDINNLDNIMIAYEPNWAVGSGNVASNEYISNIVLAIKDFIQSKFNYKIKVLYGGSVNSNNIKRLVDISHIDGFLVGKASTNYKEFLSIIEVVVNQ